jgi:hypothetical protein
MCVLCLCIAVVLLLSQRTAASLLLRWLLLGARPS